MKYIRLKGLLPTRMPASLFFRRVSFCMIMAFSPTSCQLRFVWMLRLIFYLWIYVRNIVLLFYGWDSFHVTILGGWKHFIATLFVWPLFLCLFKELFSAAQVVVCYIKMMLSLVIYSISLVCGHVWLIPLMCCARATASAGHRPVCITCSAPMVFVVWSVRAGRLPSVNTPSSQLP